MNKSNQPENACTCEHPQSQTGECGNRPHVKTGSVTYQPPMDVFHFGDRYEVVIDLPGASPDQIEASVDGDVLTVEARVRDRHTRGIVPIHGEYGIGDFHRQVRLGEDVDADRLTARYELGVLTVSLPKRPERQPRRIQVTAG